MSLAVVSAQLTAGEIPAATRVAESIVDSVTMSEAQRMVALAYARRGDMSEARDIAARMLARLNLPEALWTLPPATFSGGEQQRVNIARGFITDHPVLLLDEPTASLDAANRAVVVDMIQEKKTKGVALLGIFHDEDVRARVADRIIDVTAFSARKAAA